MFTSNLKTLSSPRQSAAVRRTSVTTILMSLIALVAFVIPTTASARPALDTASSASTKQLVEASTSAQSSSSDRHHTPRQRVETAYSAQWHAVAKKLGKRAPGRNIRKWGVQTDNGTRKATISELRTSRDRLQSMIAPAPVAAASTSSTGTSGSTTVASSEAAPGGAPTSVIQCESGGDPNAVSPDGQYHGLFQISDASWRAYGGSNGTAAGASVEEQHRVASRMPRSSWPNC